MVANRATYSTWQPTSGGEIFVFARDEFGRIVEQMKANHNVLRRASDNLFSTQRHRQLRKALLVLSGTHIWLDDIRARFHTVWQSSYQSSTGQICVPISLPIARLTPSVVTGDWQLRTELEAYMLQFEAKVLATRWYGIPPAISVPPVEPSDVLSRRTRGHAPLPGLAHIWTIGDSLARHWARRCRIWSHRLSRLALFLGHPMAQAYVSADHWIRLEHTAYCLRLLVSRLLQIEDILNFAGWPGRNTSGILQAPSHHHFLRPYPNPYYFLALDPVGAGRKPRPRGLHVLVDPSMIGTGSGTRIKPPGFITGCGHARGHLLGKDLGGDGKAPLNIVTLWNKPVNHPIMYGFEEVVKRLVVDYNQVVLYMVTVDYSSNREIPDSVRLFAAGERFGRLSARVLNVR